MFEIDALGTHWWIEGAIAAPLAGKITATIRQFEADYSRFRDDSLLSHLNRERTLENPPAEMLAMLRFAREMETKSKGVFSIGVGTTLTRLGYGKNTVKSHEKFAAPAPRVDWENGVMTKKTLTLPGQVMLDFGGFGKGWLIDKLARLLDDALSGDYVINGGGDIFVSAKEPVELALEHPAGNGLAIGQTRITRGALAASSTLKRRWKKGTDTNHHIIDPRHDNSSHSTIVASFVKAKTTLLADVIATIVIVEPSMADTFRKNDGAEILLISSDQLAE